MTDDLQAVREISDRDDLEAQFNSTVERAHVTGVIVVGPDPDPDPTQPVSDEDMAAQIAEQAGREAAAEAERRSANMLRIRGLARSFASQIVAFSGQDPCNHHPAITLITDQIEAQGRLLYDMKPVDLPPAFRQGSAREDLHHAHNIRRAIVGAQA